MNIEEATSHMLEQMEEEYEPVPTPPSVANSKQNIEGKIVEKKQENIRMQTTTNQIEKSKEKEKP